MAYGFSRPRFASSLRRRALADPRTVGFSTTGANMVSRNKERARDLLSVPGLPALVTDAVNMCWLRSASASDTLAQHPCSSPRSCARHCRLLCQSLSAQTVSVTQSALKSCVTLAPRAQAPASRTVVG